MLESVFLVNCQKINDECVQALAINCAQLKVLNVSCSEASVPYIHDETLKILVENCKHLRFVKKRKYGRWCYQSELYLSYSAGITDNGILYLTGCTNLHVLDIDGMPSITEVAILAVIKECTELKAFHICKNPNITEATFNAVQSYSKHLKKLFVHGSIANIDAEKLQNIVQSNPLLSIKC